MEKEIRLLLDSELRAGGDSRKIEGRSIVFNSLSQDLGGWKEQISPDSINDEIINSSDIFFLLNHSDSRGILGRKRKGSGSLSTEIREDGVHFSFDAPQTSLGDELLEYIRRGDITQCSFAFTVDDDDWKEQEDGTYIRTIKKFHRIYDMSAVYTPAYNDTDVKCARFAEIKAQEAARFAEIKAQKEEEAKRKMEEMERQKEQELNNYFLSIRNDYEKYLKHE